MNSEASQNMAEDQSPVEFLIDFGKKKKTFFGLLFVFLLLSVLAAFLWPRQYSSAVVFLPPQQSSSTSQAMAQLSALSGMGGVGPLKSSDELYVALLKTRVVHDAVIDELKLRERFKVETRMAAKAVLVEKINFSLDKKSGLITITARDADAEFAALLANTYFARVKHVVSNLAVTEAQMRRKYFDLQVEKSKMTLLESEKKFRDFQANQGFVVSQALAESGVKENARIRGEIALREVRLASLRTYATDNNPEVDRVIGEISALKKQLAQLESGDKSPGSLAAGEKGLQAVEAFRDMKVKEAILEAMIKQLEVAKADESREGPQLQLVDPAVPAELAIFPKRSMILIVGGAISIVMAIVLTMLVIMKDGLRRNPNGDASRLIKAWF
jgi:tyrosine-protein kinase Etk/Wzc